MASINYDEIYSRFYTKVEAFDFVYENADEDVVAEYMTIWLHSALSYPYIRRVFSTLSVDDDQESLTYEMRYAIDDFTDTEFVTELLANGMVYFWVQPKVQSITNIVQNFGTTDGRYFSQAMHLSELRALLADTEIRIRGLIRDRGYLYNTYLDGE